MKGERLEMSSEQLTAEDVLTLLAEQAGWCRDEGEADMRYVLHGIKAIRKDMKDGLPREQIIARYQRDTGEDEG